ncbi:rhodanese-like domain-containing protein [archaeon]|nr:rhodanese-like domain-containing protein [archaeon]
MAEKNFKTISKDDFLDLLDKPGTVAIDIRTPEEIKAGKITSDALEIDYHKKNFQEELEKLDGSKTYAVYCRTGVRSSHTIMLMKKLGFESAFDLDGGISGWGKF